MRRTALLNRSVHVASTIAALSACVLAGCATGTEDPVASGPTSNAQAPAAATCVVTLDAGVSTVPVTFEGSPYDVRVYVPSDLDAVDALVLDLHGSSSNGPAQSAVSGLDAVADTHGFVVVEPDGVLEVESHVELADGSWAWNVPGVPTTAGEYPPEDARDDVAFLTEVIAQISDAGCVDSDHVFATGYSGGGRMASALACERPDLLAAIAPVDGLRAGRAYAEDVTAPDPTTCNPDAAVSVLTFHGTADVVNPFDGNDDPRWGYSIDSAVTTWASLDGCTGDPVVETSAGATTTTYDACDAGTQVISHVIDGANHVWPGTQVDQSYFGDTDWGVDASAVMGEFFASHLI